MRGGVGRGTAGAPLLSQGGHWQERPWPSGHLGEPGHLHGGRAGETLVAFIQYHYLEEDWLLSVLQGWVLTVDGTNIRA